MKIIAVSNHKGGVGKTTTSINMAAYLALSEKKVLLIDLDPQAHASYGLGIDPGIFESANMYHALTRTESRCDIGDVILNIYRNFDVACGGTLLNILEQEFANESDAPSLLRNTLKNAVLHYDYIIIDCPPNLGYLTLNAMIACSWIIVPIDIGSFSITGISKLLQALQIIKTSYRHEPVIKLMINCLETKTNFSKAVYKRIRARFNPYMFQTPVRSNIALKESQSIGVPVCLYDPHSNGAKDFHKLCDELLLITKERNLEEFNNAYSDFISSDIPRTNPFQQDGFSLKNNIRSFKNWLKGKSASPNLRGAAAREAFDERRLFDRVAPKRTRKLYVTLKSFSKEFSRKAVIENISLDGIGLSSGDPLLARDYQLEFSLSAFASPIRVPGLIRWKKSIDNDTCVAGVKFVSLKQKDEKKINWFVNIHSGPKSRLRTSVDRIRSKLLHDPDQ